MQCSASNEVKNEICTHENHRFPVERIFYLTKIIRYIRYIVTVRACLCVHVLSIIIESAINVQANQFGQNIS